MLKKPNGLKQYSSQKLFGSCCLVVEKKIVGL